MVSIVAGHQAFVYVQDGFLQMGINSVSAEYFARIIWMISGSVALIALLVLNKFIEEDQD
jgi:hypothetical protein